MTEAERIRLYIDKLEKQQPWIQPTMTMVIVATMRHVANAIEGKDPPPLEKITP